jgi:chitin synthase
MRQQRNSPMPINNWPPTQQNNINHRIQQKRTRMIPLTPQGNLVIDVPVAERVRNMGKYTENDEFIYLRSIHFNW